MELTEIKVRTPEIDEAFAKVIEAFKAAVSTHVAFLLGANRKALAALISAIGCSQLGMLLVGLGIRDALVSGLPSSAIASVIGLGVVLLFSAGVLLFTCCRPRRRETFQDSV